MFVNLFKFIKFAINNKLIMLDIEIIKKEIGVHGKWKYPFNKMEVGEAFEIPLGKENSVRASSSIFSKKNPHKQFITRKENSKVFCYRVR